MSPSMTAAVDYRDSTIRGDSTWQDSDAVGGTATIRNSGSIKAQFGYHVKPVAPDSLHLPWSWDLRCEDSIIYPYTLTQHGISYTERDIDDVPSNPPGLLDSLRRLAEAAISIPDTPWVLRRFHRRLPENMIQSDEFSLSVFPEPSYSALRIRLAIPIQREYLTVVLHDLQGRNRAVLYSGVPDLSPLDIQWNWAKQDEVQFGPGVYIIEAALGEKKIQAKTTLVR